MSKPRLPLACRGSLTGAIHLRATLAATFLLGAHESLGQSCGSWTLEAATGPYPRVLTAIAFDSARGCAVLYGGAPWNPGGGTFISRQDTWEWNGSVWTERPVSGPGIRGLHGMAYDSWRQRIVLFGGAFFETPDTWEWDGLQWLRVASFGPSHRYGAAMTFDSTRGRTVLHGGSPTQNAGDLADTWEWDGVIWVRVATTGPAPRGRHAMAFDAARSRVVLFGGLFGSLYNNQFYGDTWEWDGETWRLVSVTGPAARRSHGMASHVHGVHLFGGTCYTTTSQIMGDSWIWNGSTWSVHAFQGPGERTSFAMTQDDVRNRSLVFGGARSNNTFSSELWSSEGGDRLPSITAQPLHVVAQAGTPVIVPVVATGQGLLTYMWRRNGTALFKGGVYSGIATPTLLIPQSSPDNSGQYDVVVSDSCGSTFSQPIHVSVLACYANCDESTAAPILTATDFACFISRFATQDPYTNCDGSSHPPVLTANDFMCFLNRFAAGCT